MAITPVSQLPAQLVALAIGGPGEIPVPLGGGDPLPIADAALAAAIGAPDDAAWSGTGDATVIALLKAIALNTTPA